MDREVGLIESLFELHHLRDPGRFTYRVDVDAEARAAPIPPLILLPLAENAMKHGPSAGHRGEVRVAAARSADGLSIEIDNPGPYRGPRPGSDGLPTVERRLALAYGGRASLKLTGEGDRTRAVLRLPEEAP